MANASPDCWCEPYFDGLFWYLPSKFDRSDRIEKLAMQCPYGVVGDRLWLQETWCELVHDEPDYPTRVHYAATAEEELHLCDGDGFAVFRKDGKEASPWKPSIHMPRRLSRLTLEITDVRVQRLQEISEADARSEGCDAGDPYPNALTDPETDRIIQRFTDRADSPRDSFFRLWGQLNGPDSWHANPWVWVLIFRRISA